jgi:DNA primase
MAPMTQNFDLEAYRAVPVIDLVRRFGFHVNTNRKILCPMPNHAEKTPSCHVYDHHLHCYGCNSTIDTIGFVGLMRHGNNSPTGKEFWDCVNWIADSIGLPRAECNPEIQSRYESFQVITQTYQAVWEHARIEGNFGVEYLESRGISPHLAEQNCVYFVKGYRPPDMMSAKKAGLVTDNYYFLLAHCYAFPVRYLGKIIGFCGRSADPDSKRK